MNLDKIYNQVLIRMRLRVERTLVVGSGRGEISPGGVDIPQIKMTVLEGDKPQEVPYIPGSSLKGSIRSVCETVIRTFIPDYKDSKILCYENAPEERTDCGKEGKPMCMICDTFGNTNRASKVAVDDAFLTEQSLSNLDALIQQRTGIRINRQTGTVVAGALYTAEFVPKGTEFEFNLLFTNILPAELKLVLLAMRLFNEGRFKMGGQKSRGMGSVSFHVDKVVTYLPKLYRFEPFAREDGGWRWITADELLDQLFEKITEERLEEALQAQLIYEVPPEAWDDVIRPEGQKALKELATRLYPLEEGKGNFSLVVRKKGEEESVKIADFAFKLKGDLSKASIEESPNGLEYIISVDKVGKELFESAYRSAFDFLSQIKLESKNTEEFRLPGKAVIPLAFSVVREGKSRRARIVLEVAQESKPLHDLLIWLEWAEMLVAPVPRGVNNEG